MSTVGFCFIDFNINIGSVIIAIIGLLSLIFGVYQYRIRKKKDEEDKQVAKKKEEEKKMLLEEIRDLKKEKRDNERKEKEAIEEEKARKRQAEISQKKDAKDFYLNHVYEQFKVLDFTGLNAILERELLLEKIYVRLRAKRDNWKQYFTDINAYRDYEKAFKKKEEEEREEEKDLLVEDDFLSVFGDLLISTKKENDAKPLKLLILGKPGSGKSTLMKWIALQCDKREPFEDLLPIFIPLKDFGAKPDKTFQQYTLKNYAEKKLKDINENTVFFEEKFNTGNVLFLLDGLDEVAAESIRREVIAWIQEQAIGANILIITSRFSGLHPSQGLHFKENIPVFCIQDFDLEDIEQFLNNWYRNIEFSLSSSLTEQQISEKAEERYSHLMGVIKNDDYKTLRELAINPLLLTIIAIVHRTRAILPKERHKLYEEALNVMIELWNKAHKRLDVSFSVNNSLANLSEIAFYLMKNNKRELGKAELNSILPDKIEGRPREFFIKEMILKAGLLFESDGLFGFLHLTFQEYLAAYYYTQQSMPHKILENSSKDYWTETLKLFVNIGNVSQFFDEIIDHLIEKKYWMQMNLWEDCLQEINVEKTQKEIEKKFAKKIIGELSSLPYEEETEELISQLFPSIVLYKHAHYIKEEAWHLFNHAAHPFISSVASSILHQAGTDEQTMPVTELKKELRIIAKQDFRRDKNQILEYIFRHNNSVIILLARKNINDFTFVLQLLKEANPIVKISILRDLRYLRDLPDIYLSKTKNMLRNSDKINDWVSKSFQKLQGLSTEEIQKYFPNSSETDVRIFNDMQS